MKGIRFYEEFLDKSKRVSERNVVAVLIANGKNGDTWDCVAAVNSEHSNSVVNLTTCTAAYLRKYCKRIPEERARQIHPKLFHALRIT